MQMSARAIIAIISFCVAMSGAFLGNMFITMMIGEINRKRQDGNLVSYFGFTLPKMLRIFAEYRTSYPNGKLHIYELAAVALTMIGGISLAVCILGINQPWVVSISSPADGATFIAPAKIVISADASEGNRSVLRVDFYQGATLIGSSTAAPYSVTWSSVPIGNYSLTAKATDYRGTTASSDAVSITVNAPGNIRRAELRLSCHWASFTAPSNVATTGKASEMGQGSLSVKCVTLRAGMPLRRSDSQGAKYEQPPPSDSERDRPPEEQLWGCRLDKAQV